MSLSTLRCRPGAASGSLAWTCLGESWICGVPPVWSSAVVCETASPAPRCAVAVLDKPVDSRLSTGFTVRCACPMRSEGGKGGTP